MRSNRCLSIPRQARIRLDRRHGQSLAGSVAGEGLAKAPFCKSPARMCFHVAFKLDSPVGLRKCQVCHQTPWFELGCMWRAAGIVFLQSCWEIIRKANIVFVGIWNAFEEVDIFKIG